MRSDLISRQAAIKEVETRLKSAYVWYDNEVLRDDYALSVKAEGAISALIECVLMLKGLPSAEPEPSELARDIATIIEDEMDMRAILRNADAEPQTDFKKYLDKIRPHDPHKDWFEDEPQTERPCEKCQEWDCYGCDYKQTEREGE